MDIDEVFEHIGPFGKYQFYVYALGWVPSILAGVHQLANVFLTATPHHRCYVNGCDSKSSSYDNASWISFALPEQPPGKLQCYANDRVNSTGNDTCLPSDFVNSTHQCDRWVWDQSEFHSTVVSEFNLVCNDGWLASLSQSVLMVGVLVAALLVGNLTDKYGRRLAFLIIPPLYLASTLATAFSQNYATFVVLRFLSAFCSSAVFQTSYVLCIEFVASSHRLWGVQLYQLAFSIGESFLAVTAFCIRDWRMLAVVLSVPVTIMLPFYWLLPESLSWCLANNRHSEAMRIMKKVARWNGRSLPEDFVIQPSSPSSEKREQSSICDLFRTPRMSFRSVNLSFNWLVNSLVYYGLSLSAGSLAGDTYVNFAAMSLVEIPAVLLCTTALHWVGRRKVLSTLLLLAGTFCTVVAVLPGHMPVLKTSLATMGKSSIAGSFALIYMYSAEIYPTSLRNTGIGLGSMAARIGSIAAPFVASDLGKLHPRLPMVVFGGMSLLAGLLTLALPETRGMKLPQTLEDAEKLGTSSPSVSEENVCLINEAGDTGMSSAT
uniref:Putative organic cation/carnitine transporter n=1 Tax=Ornithodoros turicata TaxID=34597 RepID=A0A2R5L514_9ACAR